MKIIHKLIKYIRDSIEELRKVTWPNKKQTITYTIIVIALSVGVALFFTVLDKIFNQGISIILK